MNQRDENSAEIRRISGGDAEAFSRLYGLYRDRVFGFAYRMLGSQRPQPFVFNCAPSSMLTARLFDLIVGSVSCAATAAANRTRTITNFSDFIKRVISRFVFACL